MADLGGIFNLASGAVSDLFGGVAGLSEGAAYKKASSIAGQNAKLTETSTALQETMAQRAAYQTISAQKADVGGAGFAAGGSALDLLRSSTQQASLTRGALDIQGAVTESGFAQQAAAYQGQAGAAKTKGSGGILSGVLQVAGIAAMFL